MKNLTIIVGHYGSGKTSIAINMALALVKSGKRVTVVDLDVVNPFFRTSEYRELLHSNGVETILPTYAGSTSDMPALSPRINAIFIESDMHYILDVGGDDVGSTILGQYASRLEEVGYDMYYVVNKYRYMTQTIPQTINILQEIEQTSRLKATSIINNSNLGELTTQEVVDNSQEFVLELSEELNLPLNNKFNLNRSVVKC